MKAMVMGFWSRYIRTCFVEEIELLAEVYKRRILPAFEGIEEEAERVSEDMWRRLSQSAGPDDDPANAAERAEEAGGDYYTTMTKLQQGIINLFTAGIYHLFEQQWAMLLRDGLFPEDKDRGKNLVQKVKSSLIAAGIDVAQFQRWDKLDELRLVANVVKHAESAASKLEELRADMFYLTREDREEAATRKHTIRRRVSEPLLGEDLYVTLPELEDYSQIVKDFWNWVAQA